MSGAERANWEQLEAENRRLREHLERALREIERLQRALEEALRAGKRQAAPHSRGEPKQNPKKPGRKAGSHYGRQTCRTIPPRVDERIPAPVPERCDRCGGEVVGERIEPQYQEEIVRRTICTAV